MHDTTKTLGETFFGSTAAFNGGAELAQLVCVQFDNGEAVFLLVGG